jgi:heat shock protein HtpX
MKRILLFLITNLAVLLVLSIVARFLGIDAYLASRCGSLAGLLAFAALFGFGGALVSLLISKWSAKRLMGVRVIERPINSTEQWLVSAVRAHVGKAGIGMPEVGVFESGAPNAFATGANRNHALVAVSTGLLQRMTRQEVEAVLGHEVTHVANGDMVTLALIQGVVNTFVIVLARIVGTFLDKAIFRNENGAGGGYWLTVIVGEIVFGLLASLIVMGFSRQREFRADAGGARLAGSDNMIDALETLKRVHDPEGLPQQLAAFGINGGVPSGLRRLLMSHPPLEVRIAALRSGGGS